MHHLAKTHLKNANNFLCQKRAWVGGLRQANSSVIHQDDYSIHLGLLRLNQLLKRQVNRSYVVHKWIVVWFPLPYTDKNNRVSSRALTEDT